MARPIGLRLVAGAALCVVLVLPAAAATDAEIDALVPVPEAADVPPVSLRDLGLPEEKPAISKASPVVAEDPALPEAIRAALADKAGGGIEDRKLRDDIRAAYEARGFRPLWIEGEGLGAGARAVTAVFAAAAADGLDPADYPLAKREPTDSAARAAIEIRLTASAVTYARHVMAGRFEPTRAHPLITPARVVPKVDEIVAALGASADPAATLASYQPPHAGYRALKAALAEARTAATAAPQGPQVPAGAILRPGGRDARVPLLRTRLGVEGDPADLVYDGALVEAVKAFQKSRGLEAAGVVGPQTLGALNRPPESRVNDLIANMEMWRWLPRDLGRTHIFVNIPEYTARVWQNGTMIHRTRVITGKPQTPTPVFSDAMEHVIVNPAWNVPPSIVRNEMLPLLASNPEAITRQGLEVMVNGRPVDPFEARYADPNRISFRQPPGERNALGKIKFMFPNQHHVYMHDTPTRALFANERRAYSHGCVRVHEPLRFGEVVFGLGLPDDGWTQARIASQFGSAERQINFRTTIPVHIAYFTLHVDETGNMQAREDVYRHVAQVKALLGLEGQVRVIANPNAAPARIAPAARPVEPPNFFEQLFGLRPQGRI